VAAEDDDMTEDDEEVQSPSGDVWSPREDKRRKRAAQQAHHHQNVQSYGHSPHHAPPIANDRVALDKGKAKAGILLSTSSAAPTAEAALRKRKNQRLASQEKKEARREKMLMHGIGDDVPMEYGHDVLQVDGDSDGSDSESLSSLPEEFESDTEKMDVDGGEDGQRRNAPEKQRHAGHQTSAKDKRLSKKMGEGKRRGTHKGKGRGNGSPTARKSGRSPPKGGRFDSGQRGMQVDSIDATDGDVSSNETDSDDDLAAAENDDKTPAVLGQAAGISGLDDEVPLPEGIDPANVEDPLLDAVPAMTVRQGNGWMEESSGDEFLFESLSDYSVTQIVNDEQTDSPDTSSGTDTSATEEDDPMLDVFGTAIGLEDSADLPLVLMEDWSGNLVFAQPLISDEGPGGRRRRRSGSKSRSRSSRSARGSRTGSTSNGDAPFLLVDPEAIEEEWNEDYDADELDGGDTTDSLPSDEDMPSPPDIGPFSLAAKGLEANNAAFGVTTIDEAALAQDLGVPLEDARNLLERVRAEDAMQLHSTGEPPVTPGDSAISEGILNVHSPSASTSNGATISPVPANAVPQFASPAIGSGGVPVMGSFLPECADPGKRAVIDGTNKNTPSPFARKGALRGRTRGKTGGSAVKKQTLGNVATSPLRRPRFSSVPAASRGRFRGAPSASPLHGQGSAFDREDTPSDVDLPAEPISIDDVLDTNALHHHTYESDHPAELDGHGSRHMRSLRRWEKVPITTFRRSRINSVDHGGLILSNGPSAGYSSNNNALRNAMTSPSIGSTLASDSHRHNLIFSQGMIISPVLHPVDEASADGSSHASRRMRKKEDRRNKHAATKWMRTSSLGVMPPLDLGER